MIRTSCCDIPDDAFDLAGVCRPNGSCAIMVRRLAAIILSAALLLGASTALAGAALAGAGALAFVPFGDGPDYRFAGSFGEAGDRSGQFDDPTGIAGGGVIADPPASLNRTAARQTCSAKP